MLLVGAFALVKRSMCGLLAIVFLLAGASFIVNLRESNANPTYAFYLLHTRAFELLIGALLAFVPAGQMDRFGRWREIPSLAGLSLIAWACFHFTKDTPFPSYNALAPCLGAALVILGNMGILDQICRETGCKGYMAAHLSSAPLRHYYSWGKYALNEKSIPYAEAIFRLIQQEKIRDVALIAYWNSYFDEYPSGALHPYEYDPFAIALLRTIKELQALGVRVIFQRQAPNYVVSVPEELAWRTLFGLAPAKGEISFEKLRHPSPQMDALERDVAATGATVVDAVAALSSSNGTLLVATDGEAFYSDTNHLSVPGSKRLIPAYRAVFAPAAY